MESRCQMEMVKVVECLLAAGVEPYHTTLKNSTPPLVSAAIQVFFLCNFITIEK